MARPTETPPDVVWNIKLVLRSPEDDDLIALYRNHVEGTRSGAAVAKAAMRSGALSSLEIEDEIADEDMADVLGDLVL